jgi:PST family polysaccharide transporter
MQLLWSAASKVLKYSIMLQKALNFIKKPTSKDVMINTIGNYFNVFFTAFFALLLVRILSPSQYGVLSVLLGIAYVLANVLDFGTTATIYSYLPPMLEKRGNNVFRFIKTIFFYQSLFSLGVILILFATFPYLDKIFFKTGAPVWELYITAFAVLFFIWQNFATNILFAAKKFLQANLFILFSNIIKTLVIVFFVLTKTVTVGSIIFAFGVVGPAVFFIFLFFDKKDLFFILIKSKVAKEEFKFGFTLTYFLASQFFNLGLRMDLFLLSFFMPGSPEIGYYGLSQKIILTIMTTVTSITQVLSPGFSKAKTKREVLHQLKIGFAYILLPAGLYILLFLTPDPVFFLFFTKKFAQTAAISRSLGLSFYFYTLSTIPSLLLLYTVKKPVYILIINIVFFVTLTAGCYVLIPVYKAFGPPYALIASFVLVDIIYLLIGLKQYKALSS